jgi:hypothetical protein
MDGGAVGATVVDGGGGIIIMVSGKINLST